MKRAFVGCTGQWFSFLKFVARNVPNCLSTTVLADFYCFVVDSGLVPALAGVSHVAIQFPTYEKIKIYLAKRGDYSLMVIFPFTSS